MKLQLQIAELRKKKFQLKMEDAKKNGAGKRLKNAVKKNREDLRDLVKKQKSQKKERDKVKLWKNERGEHSNDVESEFNRFKKYIRCIYTVLPRTEYVDQYLQEYSFRRNMPKAEKCTCNNDSKSCSECVFSYFENIMHLHKTNHRCGEQPLPAVDLDAEIGPAKPVAEQPAAIMPAVKQEPAPKASPVRPGRRIQRLQSPAVINLVD